jgi:thiol:disulfide interchange protein DsbD
MPTNAELFAKMDPALLKTSATTIPPPVEKPEVAKSETAAVDGDAPTSLAGAIGVALLAGLIFNVMPCVLPVLPLKALGFYEASHHDRGRTFLFGLSFSIGMTAVFAVLALVLLLSKSVFGRQVNWGQLFSYSWFIWTIAIILAAIAFSMLKGAAIQLPTGIYGLNFRHDTLVGNFLWGGLTAILSTPCTAFFFPALLIYAFAQPLIIGFSVITLVGVGMALPYLLLSGFPELARKFPRTGPFAEIFKQMMGFLMLVVAGLFFGMALLRDPNQYWMAYAVLVIASVYLIVRTRQLLPSTRATVTAVVVAVMLSGGGFAGAKMLTRPLRGFEYFSNDSFTRARESGDIVLVKFTAAWCLNCKAIEQTVFQNDATIDALQDRHVRLLKADLTSDDAEGWALLNQLGGNGIPFTAVYPPKSDKPFTLSSIYTTETILATVDKAKSLSR